MWIINHSKMGVTIPNLEGLQRLSHRINKLF
jgi:hypothetical protein